MTLNSPEENARTLHALEPLEQHLVVWTALVEHSEHPDLPYVIRFASEPGEVKWDLKHLLVVEHDQLMRLRGQAVDFVSDVEDRLDNLLIDYFSSNAEMGGMLDEAGIPLADVKEIPKLDFMACKNLLSQLLKKDERLGGKRGYTKLLNDIVLERNKYAHGRFYFLSPNNTPLLQWQESNGQICYAEVSRQNITDFLNACLEVFFWLDFLEAKFTGQTATRARIKVKRSSAETSR